MPEPDDVDVARAQEYSLLSALLLTSPDRQLLDRLADLAGDNSELGRAHAALAAAASGADRDNVEREFFTLFVGVGRGEILPYASYYMTGFVQGRPLADLRATLRRLGVERSEGQVEPEDHAAILMDIMASVIGGTIPAPAGTDREIFDAHLAPWIVRFFSDLERSAAAKFYAGVGTVGRVFMEIERHAFLLSEPHP
ncbi:MAG TPA: molecular chaperone TorD family protein [Steroidobacteraceae bacterium]|nr:molecular chaperone TorD family protein [Steroidobacteraceae bacterium]